MYDAFWRYSRRLTLAALVVVVAFLLWLVVPWGVWLGLDRLDPRLPEAFHAWDSPFVFWGWVAVLLGLAAYLGVRARGLDRPAANAPAPIPTDPWTVPGADPDPPPPLIIDKPFFIYWSPDPGAAEEWLEGLKREGIANLGEFSEPVRGRLIEAGLALAGERDREPEFDRPALRALFVVLAADGRLSAEPQNIGNDLRTLLDDLALAFGLHVPVHMLVTRMERTPGFLDLARGRGPNEPRQGRWGFNLGSPAVKPEAELADRLRSLRQNGRRWTLRCLAENPLDHARNARLIALDLTVSKLLEPLAAMTATVLQGPGSSRPVLRAIDLVATGGANSRDQAYLLASVRAPAHRDQAARWTPAALELDRGRHRAAWVVVAAGAALTAAAWLYILIGIGSLGWPGWVVFVALMAAWAIAALELSGRLPAPITRRP